MWPLMQNNVTRENIDILIKYLKQDDPRLTNGPKVQEFEQKWSEWLGVKHSTFVNSGASANLISMSIVKELYGDGEIIVPCLTWVSDISSVIQCGLTPVFVDINPFTLGINSELIINKVNKNTRAIFLTHVLGLNALDDNLLSFIKSNPQIKLVEDVCLPPGEKIITNDGLINVEELQINDKVLTHNGIFQPIEKLIKNHYQDNLYEFYTYGSSFKIKTTKNHPILCTKTSNILTNRQSKWIRADEIQSGDYLLYPRYKITKKIKKIKLSHIDGLCNNPKYKQKFLQRVKQYIPVNDCLMKIIGWYLAEGYIIKQHVEFSLGSHETQNIKDLCSYIDLLGFDYEIQNRTNNTPTTIICIWSKQMAEWLKNEFGNGSEFKKIPEWVINLPCDYLKHLLQSYTLGDGCKVKNRISQYSITSISLNLLSSIKIICSKLGYYSGITQTTKSGTGLILGRKVNVKNKYVLRYSTQRNNNIDRRCFIDDDYIYVRVRKINKIPFNGTVFNFEVNTDNSYCNINWAMHNCESHGATYNNQKAGTLGQISNFSFYYAHHLSSIEGGMICTNDAQIYEMSRMFRSHGMTRESKDNQLKKYYEETYKDLNPSFIFAYPAFNMRSTELNAVLAIDQLKSLDGNIMKRNDNFHLFLDSLDPNKYRTDLKTDGCSNYAMILILKNADDNLYEAVVKTLEEQQVEYRRGLSGGGNQLRQPYLINKLGNHDLSQFPEVEHIHKYGFYIGNYPDLDAGLIHKLCNSLNQL